MPKLVTKTQRCWWCGKEKPHFAHGLCHVCYRWFLKRAKEPQPYCIHCGELVRSKRTRLCKECKSKIKQVPKRIIKFYLKVFDLHKLLDQFSSSEEAYQRLSGLFRVKQRKWLKILLTRYYLHNTLEEIGKELNVSRQYINQCENLALDILRQKTTGLQEQQDEPEPEKWEEVQERRVKETAL